MDWSLWLLGPLSVAAALLGPLAAGHALLNKREPQVAAAWMAVCLMFPVGGPVTYYVFGINRVRTRARKLVKAERIPPGQSGHPPPSSPTIATEYTEQVRISDAITGRALEHGNHVTTLHNGEEAFPAMLQAIEGARESIYLATYIFETNGTGRRFIEALSNAKRRGVDVRVLIDGVGELYSWPLAGRLLRRRRVPVARFLPPRLIPPQLSINLRNHRKILVVDGQTAFTGGMNLGDRHLVSQGGRNAVADLHFGFDGPLAAQMEEVFLEDWAFTTGAPVVVPSPRARPHPDGALCRTVIDGPNEDLDRLVLILTGAISAARSSIRIVTPYFLPSRPLVSALQAAALRGVEVEVILPQENNLPFIQWATRHMLGQLIQWGVRVYEQPPPFAHTKLFLVDGRYAQVGSANMDPRSLRLNFEMTAEIYNQDVAGSLDRFAMELRGHSEPVRLSDLEQRPLHVRLRDAAFWLASPYL